MGGTSPEQPYWQQETHLSVFRAGNRCHPGRTYCTPIKKLKLEATIKARAPDQD